MRGALLREGGAWLSCPRLSSLGDSETRFSVDVEALGTAIGRIASARRYCTGLLLPGERKSIESLADRFGLGWGQATYETGGFRWSVNQH